VVASTSWQITADEISRIKENLRLWVIINAIDSHVQRQFQVSKTQHGGAESPKPSADVVEHDPAAYDYAFWAHRLLVPTRSQLTNRSILSSLGLIYTETDSRGKITFESTDVKELENAVTEVASTLPQSEDGLVDIADSPDRLYEHVDKLLLRFGTVVWGGPGEQAPDVNSTKLSYERLPDRIK